MLNAERRMLKEHAGGVVAPNGGFSVQRSAFSVS
jgi:hypothetical protein